MENNGLSKFICKLVIVKELDLETQQQNYYERKDKRKSELSKILSVKTRISDEPNFVACPSGHYRLSSSGCRAFD